MSAVAIAVGAGASIIGGGLQYLSASKAAKAQTNAANTASATQLHMYDQSREDQAPWRAAGESSLNELAGMLGIPGYTSADWTKDPGYEFQRAEGERGLNRSLAARGGLLSGAALKAASRYNQDYASNAYNQRVNRLSSLAGIGQTAANQNSTNAMATGGRLGENIIGAGNARASGYMGQANALTDAMGTGLNYWQNQQFINKLPTPSAPVKYIA